MNSKSTWSLVALALGLLAYILLFERKAAENAAGPVTIKLLPQVSPEAITAVEVLYPSNQVIRAEQTAGEWTLVQPLRSPAHATRIGLLIGSLSQLNLQSHISVQELLSKKQSLADFGLEPPQATVIFQQNTNRLFLKIGGKTPVGNQVYVQLVGSDGLFFTPVSLLQNLPREADDWRDSTFLRLKGLPFNRLKIRSGASTLELKVDESTQLWRLNQPMMARADNRRIAGLIQDLQGWPIARFLPGASLTELESFKLQPPETVLSFGQGTNDLLVAQFGLSPTNNADLIYARCPPHPSVVLVSKKILDKLRVPLKEFRDARLVSLPIDTVDLIQVSADEPFVLQRRDKGGWWVTAPQVFPADEELTQRFLGDLSALEATEFVKDVVTDFSVYGLASPARQYTLLRAFTNVVAGVTNPIIAQIQFGTNQQDRVFARLTDEDSVYAVPAEAVMRLPGAAFQLRDRSIWSFSFTNVTTVTISLQGQTRTLKRTAARQWILGPQNTPVGSPLDQVLDETLYRFSDFKAQSWIACGPEALARYKFPEAKHRLSIEVATGDKPRTLELDLGAQSPSRTLYAAVEKDRQVLVCELRLPVYQIYLELLRALFAPAAKTE